MKVQYAHGPAAVDIAATGQRVERGTPVEVDPEVGKQLIKQGWSETTPAPKSTPKETK